MFRLGHLVEGEWTAHSHPAVFNADGRVHAGVPGGDPVVFERLVACLPPPYHLLYVLHTPRTEAEPGRYQSPELSFDELKAFLERFAPYLSGDGRFELWAYSPTDGGMVVWDRHNQLFGYGPVEAFAAALRALGFTSGQPEIPVPHTHYYRVELDDLAREVIAAFDWSVSPLRPEDEQ